MAKAIEAGLPKLRIEEAAARTQARIDTGQQTVVGVNRYLSDLADDIPVLKVDNAAVRARQIDKLKRLRAERDEAACQAALDALTDRRRRRRPTCWSCPSTPPAPSATVGEISDALEAAFGRHVADGEDRQGRLRRRGRRRRRNWPAPATWSPPSSRTTAARPASWSPRWARTATTAARRSSPPPMATSASTWTSAPCSRPRPRPPQQAVENNVHVVGASSLAAGHLTLVPELKAELEKLGRPDIMIVVGGVIPPADVQALIEIGAAAVYPPGTVIAECAVDLLDKLNARLGYAQPPAGKS